jgi:hypothetical protein
MHGKRHPVSGRTTLPSGAGPDMMPLASQLGIHRSGVYRVLDKESDVEARLEGKLKAWRDRKGEVA